MVVTPVPDPDALKVPDTLLLAKEVIITVPEVGLIKFSLVEKL